MTSINEADIISILAYKMTLFSKFLNMILHRKLFFLTSNNIDDLNSNTGIEHFYRIFLKVKVLWEEGRFFFHFEQM